GRDYNKIALNLNIDEEKSIDRITGRLICQSCQTSFHKTNLPPKIEGKCDKCKSDLYQRDDDTKEIIKSRFEVYNNDTKPLIDYYQKSNILKDIDSNGSKEIVLENLLKNITQKKIAK
ncbi:MAG: hypothetical protein K1060chlam4_01172, partial [Candidatus Anoxychlamydiales bacterium]|nr:hypothetical protein [Candidatus Anoxychlamydiales bacterium]